MSLITVGDRNRTADSAKGLAASLVVAGHLITCDIASLPSPYYFEKVLNTAHMPLFFLLSGWFAVHMMERSFSELMKKVIVRLLFPYFVWSNVAVAAKTAAQVARHQFQISDMLCLMKDTLLMGTSLWFFQALFLTWMLSWYIHRIERQKGGLCCLLLLGAVMLIPLPMEQSNYALYRLHDLLPVFYFGLYARRRWDKKKCDVPPYIAAVLGLCLLLVSPCLSVIREKLSCGIWTFAGVGLELLVTAGVFVPVCVLLRKNQMLETLFSSLGERSMDIYCIHMVFVEYIRLQMPSAVIEMPQAISASAYFLEAVVIAALCVWITKAIRRFFRPYDWLMSGKWPKIKTMAVR